MLLENAKQALRTAATAALFFFVCVPASARAASSAPAPRGILLPWTILGIDAEERRLARPQLNSAWNRLKEEWLEPDAQSLSAFASRLGTVPLNAKMIADHVAVGTPRGVTTHSSPVMLEPIWCSVADHHVVFLTLADGTLNTTLASAHIAIPGTEWGRATRSATHPQNLSAVLSAVLERTRGRFNARASLPDSALHLGLAAARETTRTDEGSSHCLNLLLAEGLAPQYAVLRPTGGEAFAAIRDLLRFPNPIRRQTRVLVTTWTFPVHPKTKLALPIDVALRVRIAEAVLGQTIAPLEPPDGLLYRLEKSTSGTLELPAQETLRDFLETERRALALDDAPQVVKVYGAWAYLDKGRAWGLNLDDRLIADSPDGEVKGHVVGFYGPGLGLKSARGYTVHEGAIVFVRKGQAKAKLGMAFRFDPQTFPTPWPPVTDVQK